MKINKIYFFICLLFCPFSILAETYSVSQIKIDGLQNVSKKKAEQAVALKPGQITSEEVNASLKKLYAVGGIDQVVVDYTGSTLTFKVSEYPRINKVFITGNKATDSSDISKVINLKDQKNYDPLLTKRLSEATELYYQTLGYLDAHVDVEAEQISGGKYDLTFKINEGKKFKVSSIEIVTLTDQVKTQPILDKLQSTKYKWWSSWITGKGRLNKAYLETDRTVVLQGMLDQGYINAQVNDAEVRREGDRLKVLYRVNEGDQFRLGTYTVKGDLLDNSVEKTTEALNLETGEIFNTSKIRNESLALSDKFGDFGYAFANVTPESNVNIADKTVDLVFNTSKGRPVKVNEIKITGNNKTYDNVIRREIRVQEQQIFNKTKVNRSEALLKRTGYFEEVTITPENIPNKDAEIDLNVNVKEGSTGSFSIGGGFSSSDGALFNTRLTENNFLGTGRRFVANADIGQRSENLYVSLDDPRIADTFWKGGVQAFKRELDFRDFNRNTAGGAVSVGYPLEEIFSTWAQDINFSTQYQYINIEIDHVDPTNAAPLVINSVGKSTASSITPKLVRNTIDNPFNPTTGSRQTLSVETAGFGGTEEFYLAEVANEYFVPLFDTEFDKIVFSWRFNLGYGDTFNDKPFPLFKRYFPGGINSVRGFRERTLGPEDANGNEYGGNKQLVNNLEMIFPLVSSANLRGLVFFDAGDSFDDNQNISVADLRQSVGVGFRWISPLGPLNIALGHPLDRQGDEGSLVTLFSFGGVIN